MARGGVDFEAIGAVYATYKANGDVSSVAKTSGASAVEGKAVTITGDGEAGYGSDGAKLLGKIIKYEDDGYLTVQTGGYAKLPGVSGNLPTAGDTVCVNGSGAVYASVGAQGHAKAVSIDTTNVEVTVLIG